MILPIHPHHIYSFISTGYSCRLMASFPEASYQKSNTGHRGDQRGFGGQRKERRVVRRGSKEKVRDGENRLAFTPCTPDWGAVRVYISEIFTKVNPLAMSLTGQR